MSETMGQRLRRLRGNRTQLDVAKAVEINNSVLSRLESDDKKKPDAAVIARLAEYYGVTIDYLVTGDERIKLFEDQPITQQSSQKLNEILTPKDERDIAREVERIMSSLDSDNALAFDGEPLTDEDRQLLRISLENSLRMAREMAKKKFTPKKFKKHD